MRIGIRFWRPRARGKARRKIFDAEMLRCRGTVGRVYYEIGEHGKAKAVDVCACETMYYRRV